MAKSKVGKQLAAMRKFEKDDERRKHKAGPYKEHKTGPKCSWCHKRHSGPCKS